jgi:hypothetical protein
MRVLCCGVALAVLSAGCASNGVPNRTAAKVVLSVVVVGAAALVTTAVVKGNKVEGDLRNDLQGTAVSGRDFAKRDDEGRRWNRIARASGFVGALALIGLGIVWEMGVGDKVQMGPAESPNAAMPPTAMLPLPGGKPPAQSSATAR